MQKRGSYQLNTELSQFCFVNSQKILLPRTMRNLSARDLTRNTAFRSEANNNCIQRHNLGFFTISSQRRELFPTGTFKWPRHNPVQITCNTLSAYHLQHVVLHATWYEETAQLLRLTELKSHLFQLYFFG